MLHMNHSITMLRIPEHLKARVRVIHQRVESQMGGVPLDMPRILRRIFELGVEAMEKDLGIPQ